MIYQLYYRPEHRSRLFAHDPYRGLGIEPEVNEHLFENCPELIDADVRRVLREYKGMLHLWRNPPADGDDWIGFTSFRQLDKTDVIFGSDDRHFIANALLRFDILGWGYYSFPCSLAEQAVSCHAAFDEVLKAMPITIPAEWYQERESCLYCNYWIMSKASFDEYIGWLNPLVQWMLASRDKWPALRDSVGLGGETFVSDVMERLMIIWTMNHRKRIMRVGRDTLKCARVSRSQLVLRACEPAAVER